MPEGRVLTSLQWRCGKPVYQQQYLPKKRGGTNRRREQGSWDAELNGKSKQWWLTGNFVSLQLVITTITSYHNLYNKYTIQLTFLPCNIYLQLYPLRSSTAVWVGHWQHCGPCHPRNPSQGKMVPNFPRGTRTFYGICCDASFWFNSTVFGFVSVIVFYTVIRADFLLHLRHGISWGHWFQVWIRIMSLPMPLITV